MRTHRLGESDLEIRLSASEPGLSGGGDWAFGWGDQEDEVSIQTIHRAVSAGINWIDTAAVYGLGRSEQVVARAVKSLKGDDKPMLFTKCGLIWSEKGKVGHSLKASSIRSEVEASLKRFDGEAIDLYQIHWPVYPPSREAPDIEEGWQTLLDLKQEGKVRHIGVSNFTVDHLKRIQSLGVVVSLQPPYSLLERKIESKILPFCREHNIGVIPYSPMKSGLLTGKMSKSRIAGLPDNDWRKNKSLDFQEPKLSENLAFVERLRAIGSDKGYSPAQMAIAWTLRDPVVSGTIVGARRPDQIDGIVGAADIQFTEAELNAIEAAIPG